jgi:hypothetical protein
MAREKFAWIVAKLANFRIRNGVDLGEETRDARDGGALRNGR